MLQKRSIASRSMVFCQTTATNHSNKMDAPAMLISNDNSDDKKTPTNGTDSIEFDSSRKGMSLNPSEGLCQSAVRHLHKILKFKFTTWHIYILS